MKLMPINASPIKVGLRSAGLSLLPVMGYSYWRSLQHEEDIQEVFYEILRQKMHYENPNLFNQVDLDN